MFPLPLCLISWLMCLVRISFWSLTHFQQQIVGKSRWFCGATFLAERQNEPETLVVSIHWDSIGSSITTNTCVIIRLGCGNVWIPPRARASPGCSSLVHAKWDLTHVPFRGHVIGMQPTSPQTLVHSLVSSSCHDSRPPFPAANNGTIHCDMHNHDGTRRRRRM